VFQAISYRLPRAFGAADGGSDPSVFYLNSTSTALMTSGSVSSETNGHAQTAIIYNVPLEIFSYRLAQSSIPTSYSLRPAHLSQEAHLHPPVS
jgi:hypothetical protein